MNIKFSALAKYLGVKYFGKDIDIKTITCDLNTLREESLFISLFNNSCAESKYIYRYKNRSSAFIVCKYNESLLGASYIIVDNVFKILSKIIMFLRVNSKFYLFINMSNYIYKKDYAFHKITDHLSKFYTIISVCIYDEFNLFKILIENWNKCLYYIINVKIIDFNILYFLFKYVCPDFVFIDSIYNNGLLNLNSNLNVINFEYKFSYLVFIKTLILRLDSAYSICFLNYLTNQNVLLYSLFDKSNIYCSFFLEKEYSIILGIIIYSREIRIEIYSNIRFSLCYILEFIASLISLNISIKYIIHFLVS